jgi:biopolymer transport protein ExbD/TolR
VREGAKGLELLVLQESSAVSLDDLRKKLKGFEKGPIVIDAEVEVPYRAVQQIVSACTEEGFDKVSFAGTSRKTGAIRVLYLEGAARPEFRYLKNLLERSPEFRLEFGLDPIDPAYPGALSSYPKDLSAYDVVIVGSLADLHDQGKRTLVEWVTQSGGGVVWLTPEGLKEKWLGNGMRPICPVGLKRGSDGMKIAVKPDAPILAGLDWSSAAGKLATDWTIQDVDQDARGQGLLVTAAAGKGRAAFVGASNTFALREETGDRPLYAPFWTNVLKWAAGR